MCKIRIHLCYNLATVWEIGVCVCVCVCVCVSSRPVPTHVPTHVGLGMGATPVPTRVLYTCFGENAGFVGALALGGGNRCLAGPGAHFSLHANTIIRQVNN